jgi:putative spermidine/putrescine transport system substrate-binding protein
MAMSILSRRTFVGAAAASTVLIGKGAFAQMPLPKSPVVINVVDAAGAMRLVKLAIENYAKEKPNLVSKVNYLVALQPELPSKIKAQQDAGRVDIDICFGGYDGLTGGFDQKLWLELLPAHANALPKLDEILIDGARKIQVLAKGQGICVSYSPYGPLFEYMPDRVKKVPGTAEELLAWARENNNRFMYSRVANSGPGRTLLTGLPYILGDSDPKDPVKGWDKTWAYLKAIGEFVEYYPSGTAATMKEFGEGSRDIVPVSLGFDILPRALGTVPKEAKTFSLKGFHWTSDGIFAFIPKGVPDEKLAVLFDLLSFMLTPKQNAVTYDEGYNYPGPSVKGATLDLAPEASQKVIKEFGRAEYDDLIANNPHETPLTPEATQAAFRIWDEQIGAAKRK